MDIEQLKAEIEKVIQAIEADAHPFWFVGLIPTYPGLITDSYILQLGADWLDRRSRTDNLDHVIKKLYAILPAVAIQQINRIDIFSEEGELHCPSVKLILRNTIDYNPADYALIT